MHRGVSEGGGRIGATCTPPQPAGIEPVEHRAAAVLIAHLVQLGGEGGIGRPGGHRGGG